MRIPRSIYRFLNRLSPYQSLLILAIPLAIVEPLKLGCSRGAWRGPLYCWRSDNDLRLRGQPFHY